MSKNKNKNKNKKEKKFHVNVILKSARETQFRHAISRDNDVAKNKHAYSYTCMTGTCEISLRQIISLAATNWISVDGFEEMIAITGLEAHEVKGVHHDPHFSIVMYDSLCGGSFNHVIARSLSLSKLLKSAGFTRQINVHAMPWSQGKRP